jgi:hypothetical protein
MRRITLTSILLAPLGLLILIAVEIYLFHERRASVWHRTRPMTRPTPVAAHESQRWMLEQPEVRA